MKKMFLSLLLVFIFFVIHAQKIIPLSNDKYKVTNLGSVLHDVVLQGSVFVKFKGKDLLYTVVRGTPAHLLGYDVSSSKLLVDIPLEKTDGSWDLEVNSQGDVFIAGGSGGFFYKHTPGTSTVENIGKVLGTENYIWDLSAGANTEIYGGSYPNCKVFKYDSSDGFVDVVGGPLVEGENYVRSLVYHSESNKIFAGIGAHAELVEFDILSGKKRNILPKEYKSSKFVYDLGLIQGLKTGDRLFCSMSGVPNVLVYNISKSYFEDVLPLFSVKSMIRDPDSEKVYFVESGKLMMIDYADESHLSSELFKFRGKALASAWDSKGNLMFLNSYCQVVTFDLKAMKTYSSLLKDIPAQPIALTFLSLGPDRNLWTGGYLGGNNASYDLKTEKVSVLKGLSQTESATVLGSKIYFGNYPGARFHVYDINQPWNIKDRNPKLIGSIKGQDRPFGALSIPSLDKVFFGTVPDYGKNGGALLEINSISDEMKVYHNVVKDQSIITLSYNKGKLIGGCSIWGGLGGQPIDSEAKLFVWDIESKKKLIELVPVPQAKAITALIDGPDGFVWGYAGGILFKFDVEQLKVVQSKQIFDDKRQSFLWRPDALRLHTSGFLYGDIDGELVVIDPDSLELCKLNIKGADVIKGIKDELYYRSGKEIFRLDLSK